MICPKQSAVKNGGVNERESKPPRCFAKVFFSFIFAVALFFTVHSSVYAVDQLYDNFTRADGVVANGWTGSTWAISGGKAVNTPTYGPNLLTDPGLEATYTAGKCNTLGTSGLPALAQSADVHGGAKAQEFTGTATYDGLYWPYIYPPAYEWYRYSLWAKKTAAGGDTYLYLTGGVPEGVYGPSIADADYTQYTVKRPVQLINGGSGLLARIRTVSAEPWGTVVIDDGEIAKLDYASMFLTREFGTTNVIAGAVSTFGTPWTYATRSQSYRFGVVVALDNPANPQNYVVGYFDGRFFGLNKVLGRVETSLVSVDSGSYDLHAWGDGELLEIRRTGNAFSLWYAGRQLGTDQSITDAAIINNLYVGLYSQSPLATFTDFHIREYGTEYPVPDYSGYAPATYTDGQGILSLRFDDNDHENYDYVLGQLTSRGLVGSFAIIRGYMKEYSGGGILS